MTDYVVPVRRADRRRRPGAARRAPRRRHHRHARGLRATSTPARSARRWSRAASPPGVVVGDGSDIGGGASIMGTLSGGGTEMVSHRRALPARRQRRHRHPPRRRLRRRGRAYVTAGTKVHRRLEDGRGGQGRASCPAVDGILFRRNSRDRRRRGASRARDRGSSSTRPCTPTTERAAARGGRAGPAATAPACAAGAPRSCCSASAIGGVVVGRRARLAPDVARRRSGASARPSTGTSWSFSPEQTRQRRPRSRPSRCSASLPARAATIALATAIQESKLRQHRLRRPRLARPVPAAAVARAGAPRSRSSTPSTRPARSTTRLVKVDGYETMPRSPRSPRRCSAAASPRPTRDHEQQGRVLASALTGHSPAGLSCRSPTPHDGRHAGHGRQASSTADSACTGHVVRADGDAAARASPVRAWAAGAWAVADAEQPTARSPSPCGDRTWSRARTRAPGRCAAGPHARRPPRPSCRAWP